MPLYLRLWQNCFHQHPCSVSEPEVFMIQPTSSRKLTKSSCLPPKAFVFSPPKGKHQKCHKLCSGVSICLHPFFAGCLWIRLWQVLWSVVWTVWAVTPCVAGKLALNSEAVCRDAVRPGHWLQHRDVSACLLMNAFRGKGSKPSRAEARL